MSRKNRNKFPVRQKTAAAPDPAAPGDGIGKKGRIILASALVLIAAGYGLLKKADPAGGNVYAILAPLVLMAGYLLVPAALWGNDEG